MDNDYDMEFKDQFDEYANDDLAGGEEQRMRSNSFSLSSEFRSFDPLEIGKVVETRIGNAKIVEYKEPKPTDHS